MNCRDVSPSRGALETGIWSFQEKEKGAGVYLVVFLSINCVYRCIIRGACGLRDGSLKGLGIGMGSVWSREWHEQWGV